MGQTCLVTPPNSPPTGTDSSDSTEVSSWISRRTPLEILLGAACLLLVALVVFLLVLLSRKFAPLEPVFGSVAAWAGVFATLLGFAGAIAAIYIQGRSLRIQEDQHTTARKKKKAREDAEQKLADHEAKEKRERWVRGFVVGAAAIHQAKLKGQDHPRDGELSLVCTPRAPKGKHTRVVLNLPELDETYDVKWPRTEVEILPPGNHSSLSWKAMGPAMFDGSNEKATAWFRDNVSVDFTDPDGRRWRKYANGKFEELAADSAQTSPSHESAPSKTL